MAATDAEGPERERTRALLERIAGGAQGARLRSQIAASHPGATAEEIEEAFQEACALAAGACRGQCEGEVFAWLRTTTHRSLGLMRQRGWRRGDHELPVDWSDARLQPVTACAPSPEDELIEREQRAELQRVTRALVAGLSERQREIVALHCHGRRRPEIAQHLGMTQRSVKRALERIMALSRGELIRLAGHGCESGEALVGRLAFGLASEREMRAAQLHLATCPRCGALYERLDVWREKVAAVLPIPAVAQARPGLLERAVHAAADRLGGLQPRPSAVLEASGRLKQHAAATYSRVVDPTPLAGARPGAVAAAVAGCLAVGGGATYCVQRGVDPIAGLSGATSTARHERPHTRTDKHRARHTPRPVKTALPALPSPTPTATAVATPRPRRVVAAPTPTPTPRPAPQDEYEPASASSTTSAPPHTSSKPRTPAAAPANGPGEFDGP